MEKKPWGLYETDHYLEVILSNETDSHADSSECECSPKLITHDEETLKPLKKPILVHTPILS